MLTVLESKYKFLRFIKTSLACYKPNRSYEFISLINWKVRAWRTGLKDFWVNKHKLSFIDGRNVKWYRNFVKQFCSFSDS